MTPGRSVDEAKRPLSGVLLVGGSSRRFGRPKAIARLGGETLAERAWRLLGETCEERVAVGKQEDRLPLPFPVLDDGLATRAPLAGVVAGLRATSGEIVVVLPVDCPFLERADIYALADACLDAAVPETGPLPGAYRRASLALLEQRLLAGRLKLRDAVADLRTAVVTIDPRHLANVNTPQDLERLDCERGHPE
jgi:molybdopterin-guanine dinucleotide biosynthesis protein A